MTEWDNDKLEELEREAKKLHAIFTLTKDLLCRNELPTFKIVEMYNTAIRNSQTLIRANGNLSDVKAVLSNAGYAIEATIPENVY